MILKALCDYYDALADRGDVVPPGWSEAKVSFALQIDERGALCGIMPLKFTPEGSKKEVPQSLRVPEPVKKASGVAANFLCENSSYFLGIDNKGKPERSRQCFEAAKTLHHEILDGTDCAAARAVLAFFDGWQPESAADDPVLAPYLDEIMKGANLIFSVGDAYAQDDPDIRAAWEAHRAAKSEGSAVGRCLVTGQLGPVARLHPAIKGVRDAQSSGASLVSFNAAAFESYGHEGKETGQGLNSPVSEEAAFKYGAALNRLVSDREHTQYIGDTAVIYWAEDAEPKYQDVFDCAVLGGRHDTISEGTLQSAVKALASGSPADVNGIPLDPKNNFYVLGLAPNAARLGVRFFFRDTFGALLRNVNAHYERMNIAVPKRCDYPPSLRPKAVLAAAAGKTDVPPKLSGDFIRSVLWNRAYPPALMSMVRTRIGRDGFVSFERAAVLKADMIKRKVIEEGTMETHDDAYWPLPRILGALFAVYEEIQYLANPNINATIHDRYFSQAQDFPRIAFHRLNRLAEVQLKQGSRRNPRLAGRLRNEVKSLMTKIGLSGSDAPIPYSFTTDEKNMFIIGYYLRRNWVPVMQNDKNEEESENE